MASRFIILASQRTGSSYLVSLLNSHPKILCIGETLKEVETQPNMYKVRHSYYTYLSKNLRHRVLYKLSKKRSLWSYLDNFFYQDNDLSTGFKVMGTHAIRYEGLIAYLGNHKVKCIKLTRKNLLKKLLSNQIAKATDQWNLHGDKAYKPCPVSLSIDTLIGDLQKIEEEYKQLEDLSNELDVYSTCYEDIVGNNKEAIIGEILSFLGVELSVPLFSEMRKMNVEPMNKLIVNYEEVKACLAETSYASMLE